MPDTEENWKAAVYKWGGPPPSLQSTPQVHMLPDGDVMIEWGLKDGVQQEQGSSNQG